jgi:hypothetical protein
MSNRKVRDTALIKFDVVPERVAGLFFACSARGVVNMFSTALRTNSPKEIPCSRARAIARCFNGPGRTTVVRSGIIMDIDEHNRVLSAHHEGPLLRPGPVSRLLFVSAFEDRLRVVIDYLRLAARNLVERRPEDLLLPLKEPAPDFFLYSWIAQLALSRRFL